MRIDLHTHSTASDGTDTPAELVANAKAAGLDVVALTDHDTTGGYAEAIAALPDGLTLVTGAELSCRLEPEGIGLHMLAYLFDPDEPNLKRERDLIRNDRIRRAQVMTDKLIGLGVPITWTRVQEIAGDGAVGRPHVATAMVEAGAIGEVGDAFTDEWIGNGGRAYAHKHELDPYKAIQLVKAAGGVTVFAHPQAVTRGRVVPVGAIAGLAEAGLDGIEVDHMDHDADIRKRLRGLAGDLGLLATGSSDYHGSRKVIALGENTTDPQVYEEIVDRATGAEPVRNS
ncbi:PHP domain-containing protein [Streptomyces boninensis]|uniref:PHP domain-containing protein n=1 Tax=Streptomyces boninensis TaxID=2039455 RepID=UPI003B20B713